MEVHTSFYCRSTLRLSQMYPSLILKRKLAYVLLAFHLYSRELQ